MHVFAGQLYVTIEDGRHPTTGQPLGPVVRWTGTTWESVAIPAGVHSSSSSMPARPLGTVNGELFFRFSNHIAAFNGSTWRQLGNGVPISKGDGIFTQGGNLFISADGQLYVFDNAQNYWFLAHNQVGLGGTVLQFGTEIVRLTSGVRRWTPSGWVDVQGPPVGFVQAGVIHNGQLHVITESQQGSLFTLGIYAQSTLGGAWTALGTISEVSSWLSSRATIVSAMGQLWYLNMRPVAGRTSAGASRFVQSSLAQVLQPPSGQLQVRTGQTASLNVTFRSPTDAMVRWRRLDGRAISDGPQGMGYQSGTVTGAARRYAGSDAPITATMTISSAVASDAGQFVVDIVTACGTVTSPSINVVVQPSCGPSDVAGAGQIPGPDGELTGDDIIVFISRYVNSDPQADIAGAGPASGSDGQFTADDIILFIKRFVAGC
jgi:hypothetical protein